MREKSCGAIQKKKKRKKRSPWEKNKAAGLEDRKKRSNKQPKYSRNYNSNSNSSSGRRLKKIRFFFFGNLAYEKTVNACESPEKREKRLPFISARAKRQS